MLAVEHTHAMIALRDWAVRVVELVYENRHAAYFAGTSIAFFTLVYWAMGMKKHFDVPPYMEGREGSLFTSLYTSVLAQNNAMPDLTPKTTVARMLFMLQVALGWIWFLVLNPKSVF